MDGNDHVHGGGVGGGGLRIVQATAEERAAIRAMLSRLAESAPATAGVGRASAWAWAGLRLAAFVLLAAGVGIGLGDGDEFDDVGCTVAQQPGGNSRGARSAQARERSGGKLPGSEGGAPAAGGGAAYVFRWTGRDWEVVFHGGRVFHLPNVLGSRYLNYLLHEPNEPMPAFDLEVAVTPEKGQARSRDSIQPASDTRAKREYREELSRLQAEREKAQAAGDWEGLERVESQVGALELELKSGRGATDTGERARSNVRLAIRAVMVRLEKGSPEEREFAEDLRKQLRIGYECLYSQPEGRIWG